MRSFMTKAKLKSSEAMKKIELKKPLPISKAFCDSFHEATTKGYKPLFKRIAED